MCKSPAREGARLSSLYAACNSPKAVVRGADHVEAGVQTGDESADSGAAADGLGGGELRLLDPRPAAAASFEFFDWFGMGPRQDCLLLRGTMDDMSPLDRIPINASRGACTRLAVSKLPSPTACPTSVLSPPVLSHRAAGRRSDRARAAGGGAGGHVPLLAATPGGPVRREAGRIFFGAPFEAPWQPAGFGWVQLAAAEGGGGGAGGRRWGGRRAA